MQTLTNWCISIIIATYNLTTPQEPCYEHYYDAKIDTIKYCGLDSVQASCLKLQYETMLKKLQEPKCDTFNIIWEIKTTKQ
jgi:hypothetical protein